MRHPAVLLLDALLEGIEVKIGETTYVMGDRHDLCWVGMTDGGEKRYVVVLGETLPDFVKLAESMTADERTMLAANLGLNRVKAKSR